MQPLIDDIRAAFADVSYPGDDNLTDSTYGEEPAALAREFAGKSDRDALDTDFLAQAPDGWGTAISFFSPDAFRFYLPVYMIADIRGELTYTPDVRLCSGLTPLGAQAKLSRRYGGGTMGDRARAEFARYTPAQVSAIVAYLWWKLDNGGDDLTISQSLEYYWLQRQEDTRRSQ